VITVDGELTVEDSPGYEIGGDWLEIVELEEVDDPVTPGSVTEGTDEIRDEELNEALPDSDIDIDVDTPGGVYIEGRLRDEVEVEALLDVRTPPLDRDRELDKELESEMVSDTL